MGKRRVEETAASLELQQGPIAMTLENRNPLSSAYAASSRLRKDTRALGRLLLASKKGKTGRANRSRTLLRTRESFFIAGGGSFKGKKKSQRRKRAHHDEPQVGRGASQDLAHIRKETPSRWDRMRQAALDARKRQVFALQTLLAKVAGRKKKEG